MNKQHTKDPWEIEDYLDTKNIFQNGITGKPAHSDSYMTVVDYENLDKVLADNPYDVESWAIGVNYWLTNPNMQPPLKLVAKSVARHYNIPLP